MDTMKYADNASWPGLSVPRYARNTKGLYTDRPHRPPCICVIRHQTRFYPASRPVRRTLSITGIVYARVFVAPTRTAVTFA
jgi:hypothetical protein